MCFSIEMIRDEVVTRIRQMANSGSSTCDIIRYIIKEHESKDKPLLIGYFQKAFHIELQYLIAISGWCEIGAGELTEEKVNEFVDPYLSLGDE